jgi:hypothetical protein
MNRVLAELTWPIRRRWYKIRLFWNCSKEFYAPWEAVEMLLTVNFEILVDVYKNGELDIINWDSDDCHKLVKNEIDYLYNWWTKERKEEEDELDYLLDIWSEHHVSWFEKIIEKDHPDGYKIGEWSEWKSVNSKYGNYINKLYMEKEESMLKKEQDNLIRLIKIRGYLWT